MGALTDGDVQPHRDARILVQGEGDGQVKPGHALRLVEVAPCFLTPPRSVISSKTEQGQQAAQRVTAKTTVEYGSGG